MSFQPEFLNRLQHYFLQYYLFVLFLLKTIIQWEKAKLGLRKIEKEMSRATTKPT
jgi:hypothetical protein